MDLTQRIAAFSELGDHISNLTEKEFARLAEKAEEENLWFTSANIQFALKGISKFLSKDTLQKWTDAYNLNNLSPYKVGLTLAGNIPLVGFHDMLCVLIAGHQAVIKPSSQDTTLIKYLANQLIKIDSRFESKIEFAERLNHVDAIIATGSDNTARYFEYYFRDIPHIIRKNRSSAAVLMGEEPSEQLSALGTDVFTYFGLGCRNVSKLYIPEGFDFKKLFMSWESFKDIVNHSKYGNNYDYQKAIHLLNQSSFFDNNFVLLIPNQNLVSPISVVYYEYYKNNEELDSKINTLSNKLQCLVSANGWYKKSFPFGEAQFPTINDYADNIDTLKFLEFRS